MRDYSRSLVRTESCWKKTFGTVLLHCSQPPCKFPHGTHKLGALLGHPSSNGAKLATPGQPTSEGKSGPVETWVTGPAATVLLLLWQPVKAEILQESVSPVQQFVGETCLISIMITKGPQLISKTNIPLLIPRWWRLCTDIRTAYICLWVQ